MKRLFLLGILVAFPFLCTEAQDKKDDFKSQREGIMSGFQKFRKSILDDYSKFLTGVWERYKTFRGDEPYPLPKPKVQPEKKKEEPAPKPKEVIPDKVKPAEPKAPDKPTTPKPVAPSPSQSVTFDWCGMTMRLPNADISANLKGIDKESLVEYFEILENSRISKDVLSQIANLANGAKFNDWCLCLLIQSYVKGLKANADNNTRNFICWYMMAQFGFDVRLSFNGNNLFYLIPFKQKVFSHTYILINEVPYYVWGEGKLDENIGLYSPPLPEDAGEYVNLVLTRPLDIPYKAKRFSHTFSDKTLSGEVNENLIKVMANFPQMPIPAYVLSEGDSKARQQVLNQMGKFISGMSELEAANFILQFIQSYDYATDDEQFGYEKPFFIEETLYYPKCDCEDRAIFYHFLVSNLLRNDVHLVHYPNHECNAVNFSQKLNADYYMYQGKQYVICDPTYVGATIGMCMPDFKNTRPEIELVK